MQQRTLVGLLFVGLWLFAWWFERATFRHGEIPTATVLLWLVVPAAAGGVVAWWRGSAGMSRGTLAVGAAAGLIVTVINVGVGTDFGRRLMTGTLATGEYVDWDLPLVASWFGLCLGLTGSAVVAQARWYFGAGERQPQPPLGRRGLIGAGGSISLLVGMLLAIRSPAYPDLGSLLQVFAATNLVLSVALVLAAVPRRPVVPVALISGLVVLGQALFVLSGALTGSAEFWALALGEALVAALALLGAGLHQASAGDQQPHPRAA